METSLDPDLSRPAAGRLLVATPSLTEDNFARTVVLLLQHDPDEGALGVVVNRPSDTAVGQVLPGWDALAAEPDLLFSGGPVQPDAAICLGQVQRAGVPDRPVTSSACAVLPGSPLLATVDLDSDPDAARAAVRQVRVFAGYAGWLPGQLEAEVEEGAWWVVDALPGDSFSPEPGQLWRQVLQRQGVPLALVASYPEDPTLN